MADVQNITGLFSVDWWNLLTGLATLASLAFAFWVYMKSKKDKGILQQKIDANLSQSGVYDPLSPTNPSYNG